MPSIRRRLFIALTLVAGGLCSVTLLELGLQSIAGPWNPRWLLHHRDPDVGPWTLPGRVKARDGWGEPHYLTWNSFGMRDKPRALEKTDGITRIAVIGDSFMESLEVDDDETGLALLEDRLEGVEVLNFSKIGIGTCTQYQVYLKKVRRFRPDIVILAVLPFNDISDSAPNRLRDYYVEREGSGPHAFFERNSDGLYQLEVWTPELGFRARARRYARRHSAIYRTYAYFRGLSGSVQSHDPEPDDWPSGFHPPKSPQWRTAWENAEFALRQLHQVTQADGAELRLAVLPSSYSPDEHTARVARERELPADFDWDYPNERVLALAESLGIPALDLTPPFRREVKRRGLTYPWFSYPDDGHWNEEGHAFFARTMAEFLGNPATRL